MSPSASKPKRTYQQQYEDLANHIVLPRVLPQKKSVDLHGDEMHLMSIMVKNVEFMAKCLPRDTVSMFQRMMRVNQNRTAECIAGEINALKPGETFAMFIRRQNCAFMVRLVTENDAIVASFPGNLHPKEVYARQSDIEFTYPVQALKVSFSKMLRSVEFADQLRFLYIDQPIDTKNRNYVSKWLMTILTDESSKTAHEYPTITKKIRDEVLGVNTSDYFRRSSLYMCLKVFLQHSLTMELGHDRAKILYKIVMLRFHNCLMDFFASPVCETLNIALMSDVLAKSARRIEKLSDLIKRADGAGADYNDVYAVTVDESKRAIATIRLKIDEQIGKLQRDNENQTKLLPLAEVDFPADIYQGIPNLIHHWEKRTANEAPSNNSQSSLRIQQKYRHYMNGLHYLDITKIGHASGEVDVNLLLSDIENWILYNSSSTDTCYGSDFLRKLSYAYASSADRFYCHDQLGTSKMVLVRLKLIAMLDANAAKAHPLFAAHHSSIDTKIFEKLLLPQRTDMQIAYELEQYFNRRNAASGPSLIGERKVTSRSFTAKFAARNATMNGLLEDILDMGEAEIKKKRKEWNTKRAEVIHLREEASRMTHDYYTNYKGFYKHAAYCGLCKHETLIASIKMTQYERPLPDSVHDQHAVIFELKAPIAITCLRDVLFNFAEYCSYGYSHIAIVGEWVEYHQINTHNQSTSEYTSLGSTTTAKLQTYHVDNPFDDFIIENGYNCTYHASRAPLGLTIPVDFVKKSCTFTLDDEYGCLQWSLSGTSHTQNEVLARQSECPQSISLSEFKNFGSLRADGHRLQLRKLFCLIETEALSFEKTSILSLIMQSLWEAGISGDDGTIRESFADFSDPIFAQAMIELLSKFSDQQSNNWVHPKKLLMSAFIAVRVFEINNDEDVANGIVELLEKIRIIALKWMESIEGAINDIQSPDIKDEQELRMKLAVVAITGVITFFVHSQHAHFSKIFTGNSYQEWCQFIVTLNNNVLLNQSTSNLMMFLRLVRNIGIHIEAKMRSIMESNPKGMQDFVKRQWKPAEAGSFLDYYFYTLFPQVLVIEVTVKGKLNYVTIDIITGSFLVNSYPVARLPDKVRLSAVFQRVFDNFVFEVQPDSQLSFSTVRRYNGCGYEFRWSGSEIIITEKRDGFELELVPHEILNDEIPYLLVQNHSHFWNKTESTIEFRPKCFNDKYFSVESGIEYRLDLHTRLLTHIKTKRHMLDITKGSYKKIVNQLSRLETSKYIHIYMDKPQIAKVELVRMRLKFKVDCTTPAQCYDLLSNEFSRMRVSRLQNIGTLYGLQHGLLLESVPVEGTQFQSTKLFIFPHGTISSTVNDQHVSVDIDLESGLRSPPFHQYEIDEFCRQVKASNSNYSAWFYLAYLHAVTSHGEVEPFIKMSGTERALQILQSSFAWSSVPYDKEAADMLRMIIDLTPRRNVKESFQTVIWPSIVPAHASQDSFVFIAKKLLADSVRLEGLHLHRPTSQQHLSIDFEMEYNRRQYLRCLPLHRNLRASDEFIHHEILTTTLAEPINSTKCPHTQTVSILYHRHTFKKPLDFSLKSFLKSASTLDGITNKPAIQNILHHKVYQSFHDLWISLYEYARDKLLTHEQFVLIWSVFAHENKPLAPILALQSILMKPQAFRAIDPPPMDRFFINKGTYSAERVSQILNSFHSNPYNYDHKDFDTVSYDRRVTRAIDTMTRSVTNQWPCDQISLNFSFDNFNLTGASRKISSLLKVWNDNRKLDNFIQSVQQTLDLLMGSTYVNIPNFAQYSNPFPLSWPRYESDWTEKMYEQLNDFESEIQEAENIWKHQISESKSADYWWNVYEKIVNGPQSQHLINAGIYPRVVPSLVLPQIASKESNPLKMVIGALAIATVREQREQRLNTYSQRPELRAALEREMEHEPHFNWNPSDYPEWLLFEIEQNLMIRRIQIEIAKRMINPPDIGTKHSVMQLNMGEGKTAVIVPILASILSDGKQTCQITVLKSLYATNLKSLRRYLGGMLNRKIYVFPCRRDMPIGQYAAQILGIYEETKQKKGVILTLPEYRLSFQLKIYESVKKSCLKEASQFLAAHKWINSNVRSILDESDAILHPKYQLIYTVGNQQQLDGGASRWLVVQSLLKRIPHHMRSLTEEHGQEKVEFDENYVQNGHVHGTPAVNYRSDVFTPCRILDERVYYQLKKYLIQDFLEGRLKIDFPEITDDAKKNFEHLLTERIIDTDTFNATIEDLSMSERNTIMILSGLLRFEVLKLILMRRWRVNYGVNAFGQRKMAIPFKAKDVAAEMTEFGHPDVAIGFTHLSYYYSGLTDGQLKETFKILSVSQNPAAIYERWVESVCPDLIDASIRSYTGVNLSDPHQRDSLLYPVFRFNMHVVDFWLSTVVFPHEAKTFEKKLICTAWDLCSEHMQHPVTGFSGTNDTKNILPMPIAQNDLDELEDTNENVRKILLRQRYDCLPANVSGRAIVEKLVEENCKVLLDAGALMLELNNREVAEVWLELTADHLSDAAIYFDRNDVLQTIDRNGVVTELDCSVYRDNLSRCLIYLDDVHTRGTDLKFPLEWNACVTLSGTITRDKTVQACMRMRQLGRGQTIVFWASYEADVRIREIAKMPYVSTEDVVQFICNNSLAFETDNTVHWTTGAYNYTQKLIAHKLHDDSDELQDLYAMCADDEFLKLQEMYGDKEEVKLSEIARNKFDRLIDVHRNEPSVSNFAKAIRDAVNSKICKQASNVQRYIKSLDEEQEKELEHDLEEERQVERPPVQGPAVPHLDKKLLELIVSPAGKTILADLRKRNVVVSLFSSLSNTRLIQAYANEATAWADHLFVTNDFMRVLSDSTSSCDEYLRPVWWIGQVNANTNKRVLILFSSFECDRLKSAFRRSQTSVLYMYRPKLSKLHSQLLHDRKLQITGMINPPRVSVLDQVQIEMYAGSMYFDDEDEQNAYCNFLGLIPRPRTQDQNAAFKLELIKPNGFVPIEHREYSPAISDAVNSCKFNNNPVDLAIKLVEAHHCSLHEESHVSSILKRGTRKRKYE